MFLQWLQLATGEETVLCARLAHPWVPFRWVPHSSGAALNASPPRQVGIRGQTPWNKIQWCHGTKRQMLINKLSGDHLLWQEARFKNFNPLDDQILGVFKRREQDSWDGVQILEIKKKMNWRQRSTQIQIHSKVKCVVLTVGRVSVSRPYQCKWHLPKYSWLSLSFRFLWTAEHSICFSRWQPELKMPFT